MHARHLVVSVVVSLTLGTAACGGGGGHGSDPAPSSPGANVDPAADGVIGGSINKAKDVGADAEQRDAQLEE